VFKIFQDRRYFLQMMACTECASTVIGTATDVLILMPVYPGSLQDTIDALEAQRAFMDGARVAKIFRRICTGVQKLHSLATPLAHRDLKPGNVLLSKDDEPALMDFGSVTAARYQPSTALEAKQLVEVCVCIDAVVCVIRALV
jgi:serine/threonine protein kinase